jgi:hypothetical protein
MAPRPYWKGYLRLSLVSLGVHLYNATESKAEISFRQIHKPTGKRVNYTKTVVGVGKIENEDIVKGFEVGDDTYVTFERDELDALRLESSKTIDLVRFVDASEIDYRFFEKPYFLVPADEHSAEAFAVVRDALRKSGKVTGCITLKLRYSDFQTHTFQNHIEYTASDHVLLNKVLELFKKNYSRRVLIRLIGVKFSNMVSGFTQINLYEDTEEMINLYQAMDRIRKRYGFRSIMRSINLKPQQDV